MSPRAAPSPDPHEDEDADIVRALTDSNLASEGLPVTLQQRNAENTLSKSVSPRLCRRKLSCNLYLSINGTLPEHTIRLATNNETV